MVHKKTIKNQNYEDYWKLTLATTDFYANQFIRTLKLIIEHIDKYDLAEKSEDDLVIRDKNKKKVIRLNQDVTHSKELEENIKSVFINDDVSGASTRKQINEYIKLGFIKPYLNGYPAMAKKYIKPNQSLETLKRLFSDIVYQYASFNSSRIKKSPFNQIKFLVQTILNRQAKYLTADELIGLMYDTKVLPQNYAREKTIQIDANYAKQQNFGKRKYNQISYLYNILSKMSMFQVIGKSNSDKIILLVNNMPLYIPTPGDTKRDQYRFSLMRNAVYEESKKIYGKKQCWLTGYAGMGLVVSHLYSSHAALAAYDNDAAYDPQNALLLAPGDPDQYVDKYKMTFDKNGTPIFPKNADSDFVSEVNDKHYKIDKKLMTPERWYYMKKHNERFAEVNKK